MIKFASKLMVHINLSTGEERRMLKCQTAFVLISLEFKNFLRIVNHSAKSLIYDSYYILKSYKSEPIK